MSLSTAPLRAHTHVEGSAALSHGRARLSSLAEEGGQKVCVSVSGRLLLALFILAEQ